MATYKTSWVRSLVDNVWTKTFAFAHAKTVYTDYENGKTLDKSLEEVQKRISDNGYGEIAGGKNLLNISDFKQHYNLSGDDGDYFYVTEDYIYADEKYIPYGYSTLNFLCSNEYLSYADRFYRVACYDSNKSFLIRLAAAPSAITTKLTLPEGTKYIRLGINFSLSDNLENMAFTNSDEYEPYFPSNRRLAEEKADKSETTVNLLNPTFESTAMNGVKFTNNGDGSVSILGALSSNSAYTASVLVPVNIGQTYKVIGKFIGVYKKNNATKILQNGVAGDTSPSTFTAIEDFVNVCMYVSEKNSIPMAGVISYPMLTTNLSATYEDFVPYTGDTGSLNGDVADLRDDVDGMDKRVSTQKLNIHYGTGDGNNIVPVKGTSYIKTPPILVDNSANTFEDAQEGSGGGGIKTFDYTYALKGSVKFTVLDTLITANTTVSGITVKPSTSVIQNGHYYRITGTATEDVTIPLYSVKNPSSDTLMFVSNIINKFSESTFYYLISDASGNTKQFGTEEEKTDTTTFRNHSGEVKVSLVVKSGAKVSLSANVRAGYSGAYSIMDRSDKKYSDTADSVLDAIIEMKSK